MQDKLLTTSDIKGSSNSITVKISSHDLSEPARKLFALAITMLPQDLSSLDADFTFSDFCNAVGMPKCENTYQIFKNAVDECMRCIIAIETEPNTKGRNSWQMYKWLTYIEYSEETEQAIMKFYSPLTELLTAIKLMYSKAKLTDISQLQNRYAIKIFELAIINMSISMAIKNNLDTNLEGKSIFEEIKQGKQLTITAFDCKKPRKRRSKEPIPDPNPVVEVSKEEYLDYLKYLYPTEFDKLYKDALITFLPYIANDIKQLAAEGAALLQLKAGSA